MGLLQARQVVLLLTDLLTVRIVLSALGVTGYGVYAAVAGFVTSFALLHNVIQTLAQRFLSVDFSQEGNDRLAETFSSVLCLTLGLCALIVLTGETAGLWFVSAKMRFPQEFGDVVRVAYRLCLSVVVVRTLQLPFFSLIVASERLAFLLKATALEAVLAAGTAAAVWWRPALGVAGYATGLLVSAIVLLAVLVVHCRLRFVGLVLSPGCRLQPLRRQGGFFLWSLLSTAANTLKYQGVSVLVNLYAGVLCNATWMATMKVGFGFGVLIGNFQQAFQPRLVRHWIKGDHAAFWRLEAMALRGTALATAVVVLPFLLCPRAVLSLWLGDDLPPQAVAFMRCVAVHYLLDSLTGPLTTAIVATGRIARYQVGVSIAMGSGFFLAWAFLAAGLPAWTAVGAVALGNALSLAQRLAYMRACMGLRVLSLLKRTFLP